MWEGIFGPRERAGAFPASQRALCRGATLPAIQRQKWQGFVALCKEDQVLMWGSIFWARGQQGPV
eukprot:9077993-Lingulodinium_polyedra.AAC.1